MNAEIDDCKTAILHLIGHIQSYGVMLVIDRQTGKVTACSQNTLELLGSDTGEVLGTHWSAWLEPQYYSALEGLDKAQHSAQATGPTAPLILQGSINGRDLLISGHLLHGSAIIEFEPWSNEHYYAHSDRLLFLQQLANCQSPGAAAELLLDHIATISGFERVMLYRFLPDWHGKVTAERLDPGVQGFLGLHFPAGDIPENARRLYTLNIQRLVADISAPAVPVVGHLDDGPIDMTYAQLRAVHPVHLQYLANIGAQASFSVSILVSGQLWGMIACHHGKPVRLGFRRRTLCDELARIVSIYMTGLSALEAERRNSEVRELLSTLQGALQGGDTPEHALKSLAADVLELLAADALWLRLGKREWYQGSVPSRDSLLQLEHWMASRGDKNIYHASSLPDPLVNNSELVRLASGLLVIPLDHHDFILFMRREQLESVEWAGRPAQLDEDATDLLTPRTSFLKWTKQVYGRSLSWQDNQLEFAGDIRDILNDYFGKSELEQLALQDPLTGLANRARFDRELADAIRLAGERGEVLAVFMMDLDHFKEVNDSLGHAAGDELLVEVADRLRAAVRGRDIVSRFGGDEFSIILRTIKHSGEVEAIAGRILDQIRRPFLLRDRDAEVGISIGIAFYPEHAATGAQLVENADAALYAVKRSGRNAWRIYDTGCEKTSEQGG